MASGNTWINALIGGVITLVLSFTALSPLLGGGVAGYLQAEAPRRGAKIGALSGAIAVIPLFFLMFLAFMFMAVPGTGMMPGGVELAIIFMFMFPILALWFVGLSAVGGYLGAYLRQEKAPTKPGDEMANAASE